MNYFVISDIDSLERIKDAWSSLFSSLSLTIFQSWELNYIAATKLLECQSLSIFCIGNQNNLDFIFPAYVDENKTTRFLQTGFADYLDVLCRKSMEHVLYREFSVYLSSLKYISLINITNKSTMCSYLPLYLRSSRFNISHFDSISHFCCSDIDDSKCLVYLNSEKRKKIKALERKFNHVSSLLISDRIPILEIDTLANKMIKSGIRSSGFLDVISNYKDLYNLGMLNFFVIYDKENVLALNFVLTLNDSTFMSWIALYDPDIKNSNIIRIIKLIELCGRFNYNLSLGTGVYGYKLGLFQPRVTPLFAVEYGRNYLFYLYRQLRKLISRFIYIK